MITGPTETSTFHSFWLSGHDHQKVDKVIDGTRLTKPGMNGVSAAVIEISWPDNNDLAKP